VKLKYLGHSANDLYWFILPLILPGLLSRFDLSYSQAGGILTIYLFITALGSFVLGKLSDRIGRKEILGFGFLMASSGFIAAGFAPSFTVFLVIIAITAIGVSTFHPLMYAILDETMEPGKKGRILGVYETFGSGAIFIMFLVNGFLFNRLGIRGVLVLTAIPGLLMGLFYLRSPNGQLRTRKSPAKQKGEEEPAGNRSEIILFLITVITRILTVTALMNFLPVIFVKHLGFAQSHAAYSTAVYFAGGITGNLIVGRISDRINSYKILIVCSLLIVLSIFLIGQTLAVFFYLLAVFLFGGAASACFINQNLVLTRLGSHLNKGEVFGILMGTITITSSISPAIFGTLIDSGGFSSALFLILFPILISIVVLSFLLARERK
jgi:SHS family lactate transporter-like MFS transporter